MGSAFLGITGAALFAALGQSMASNPPDSDRRHRAILAAADPQIGAYLVLRPVPGHDSQVADFVVEDLNGAAADMLSVSSERARGGLLSHIAPISRSSGLIERCAAVLTSGRTHEEELHATLGGLQEMWMRQRIVPFDGGVVITAVDVTRRRREAVDAERNERLLARLTSTTPDLLLALDLTSRSVLYQNHELPGGQSNPWDALIEGDRERFDQSLARVTDLTDGVFFEETFAFQTSSASVVWMRCRFSVLARNDEGRAFQVLIHAQDVSRQLAYERELEGRMSQLRQSQEELEARQRQLEEMNSRLGTLALTDSLTGLKNQRAFQDRLAEEVDRALRYGLKLSLMIADVDHFKAYNDRYGHPAGDEALRGFAEVLTNASRSSDVVVRYGGEEFALILPNTSAEEAAHLGDRIRKGLRETRFGAEGVTTSIGCAELRSGGDARARLITDADRALYASKHAGRDRVTIGRSETHAPRVE